MNLLEVERLKTFFVTDHGIVKPVRDVSLTLGAGEVLGIVGESGSGKSVTMFSITGLLAKNGYVGRGKAVFDGDVLFDIQGEGEYTGIDQLRRKKAGHESAMTEVLGKEIGMIFQDPMTYLNPVLTIGYQMEEGLRKHFAMTGAERKRKCLEMLKLVGITNPEKRLRQYPFELSGGMRQRVIIATALISGPKLLIADEPTTALDVTIQAQILELLLELREKLGMSVILITHDLGVVASTCTRILIMYGGQIVEAGTDQEIFYKRRHPYTDGLLRSVANYEKGDKEKLTPIDGNPPDLLLPPVGCAFVDRCDKAMGLCKDYEPPDIVLSPTHTCKCWLVDSRVESGEGRTELA